MMMMMMMMMMMIMMMMMMMIMMMIITFNCGERPIFSQFQLLDLSLCRSTEAVVWRCSIKKVLLEISQNSLENTCARDSFLINFQA